jgi:hypothetical protein
MTSARINDHKKSLLELVEKFDIKSTALSILIIYYLKGTTSESAGNKDDNIRQLA